MQVELGLRLSLGRDRPVEADERLFVLLRAVDEHGSLRRASEEAGLSYRAAWGLLRDWAERLGQALVVMQRGRGADLSDFGRNLVQAEQHARDSLGPALKQATDEVAAALDAAPVHQGGRLTVHASHSMAQDILRRLASDNAGLQLDFHNHGSLASLRALKEHDCEMAGFHIADGALRRMLAPHFRPWLDDNLRLLRVASRRQGFMMGQRAKQRVRGVADLTGAGVQFVNRQSGSGTRLLIDALLKSEAVDASRIRGYEREEFTHTAVAALVRSGAAEVGFGEEAAARQFGLAFLPLVPETYYFAVDDAASWSSAAVQAMARVLAGREFRERVSKLGGYDAIEAGRWEPVQSLFS